NGFQHQADADILHLSKCCDNSLSKWDRSVSVLDKNCVGASEENRLYPSFERYPIDLTIHSLKQRELAKRESAEASLRRRRINEVKEKEEWLEKEKETAQRRIKEVKRIHLQDKLKDRERIKKLREIEEERSQKETEGRIKRIQQYLELAETADQRMKQSEDAIKEEAIESIKYTDKEQKKSFKRIKADEEGRMREQIARLRTAEEETEAQLRRLIQEAFDKGKHQYKVNKLRRRTAETEMITDDINVYERANAQSIHEAKRRQLYNQLQNLNELELGRIKTELAQGISFAEQDKVRSERRLGIEEDIIASRRNEEDQMWNDVISKHERESRMVVDAEARRQKEIVARRNAMVIEEERADIANNANRHIEKMKEQDMNRKINENELMLNKLRAIHQQRLGADIRFSERAITDIEYAKQKINENRRQVQFQKQKFDSGIKQQIDKMNALISIGENAAISSDAAVGRRLCKIIERGGKQGNEIDGSFGAEQGIQERKERLLDIEKERRKLPFIVDEDEEEEITSESEDKDGNTGDLPNKKSINNKLNINRWKSLQDGGAGLNSYMENESKPNIAFLRRKQAYLQQSPAPSSLLPGKENVQN
ncbi:MAG: hypothetical protein EZS28_036898, partial [Streblomastix strix]